MKSFRTNASTASGSGGLGGFRPAATYLTKMNTGEEGLLTAPLLSVTVRLNARVVDICGAVKKVLAVFDNTPTLGPLV